MGKPDRQQTRHSNVASVLAAAAALLSAGALVAGCGGGGASDTNSGPTANSNSPTPAPTLSVALAARKTSVGSSNTLTWASTDATSCTGGGEMSGAMESAGTLTITPAAGGSKTYTVSCTGPGGSVTRSVELVVPMPVFATGYENKHAIAFDGTQVPTVRTLGIPKVHEDEQDSNERSVAFGDFFQEGAYSAFVAVNRFGNIYGDNSQVADIPGVVYFLAKDASGKWVDRSAELVPAIEDRKSCVWSSYSIVADFNNDGRPDVYMACHSYDWYFPEGMSEEELRASQVAEQVLFLSQPGGQYRRIGMPDRIYGHRADAADLDGDGNVDIVTTDAQNKVNVGLPFVLFGRGDGTFRRDDSLLNAQSLADMVADNGIWNVFLIPIGDRIDIVFGGGNKTIYARGLGGGRFDFDSRLVFERPVSARQGSQYIYPLDVYYDSAKASFYLHTNAHGAEGEEWAVLKYSAAGQFLETRSLWLNATATLQPYSAQFKATADGYFVAYTGGCGREDPAATTGCGMRVPR